MQPGIEIGDVATWTASTIAVVSACYTVWWPMHNRPQASWSLMKIESNVKPSLAIPGLDGWLKANQSDEPDWIFELTNDGDGDAHQVMISGIGCNVRIIVTGDSTGAPIVEISQIAHLGIAETVYLLVWRNNKETERTIDVHWTLQPTRNMKRVHHEYVIEGKTEERPWRPIPVHGSKGQNLTMYRIAHSHLAARIRSKFPGFWDKIQNRNHRTNPPAEDTPQSQH